MPDRRRSHRLAAVLGALLVAAAVVAPGSIAVAQEAALEPAWEGSTFPDVTKRTPTFELTGRFQKVAEDGTVTGRTEEIASVRVTFTDSTDTLPDDCSTPDPHVDSGNGERSGGDSPRLTYSFVVPDDHEWTCNGRYLATATATTTRAREQAIEATITVAIPPKSVHAIAMMPTSVTDATKGEMPIADSIAVN